jgi:hypothetical protein
VGFDPRVGPPPVEPGAILIDFNEGFGFPVMWPHFPLEFAFVFIELKLAFWHADLLCRMAVLKRLAAIYKSLADGEMAAVYDIGGRRNYSIPVGTGSGNWLAAQRVRRARTNISMAPDGGGVLINTSTGNLLSVLTQ